MTDDVPLIAQVSNVSSLATLDQIEKLFGYMGKIKDIRMYPTITVVQPQFKVCYIKYAETSSVRVALHLTNTVFIDRALVVVALPGDNIPSEDNTAFDMLNPTSALPALLSSGCKDVTNDISALDGNLVITSVDTNLDILGLPQYPPLSADQDPNTIEEIRRTVYIENIHPQVSASQLLDFINGVVGEVKYLRMAGHDKSLFQSAFVEFTDRASIVKALQCDGITLKNTKLKIQHSNSAIIKPQKESEVISEKDTEEAMKRLKEAESLIARVVEPEISGKSSRSRRRSSSRPRRRSRSASRRSSHKRDKRSRSKDRRKRSTSRRRRSRSRSKVRRSRSRSKIRRSRSRKRSKRSYSRTRRSHSKQSDSKSKSSKRSRRSRSRSPHSRPRRSRRSRSRSHLTHSRRRRSRSKSEVSASKRNERSRSRSRLSRSHRSRSRSHLIHSKHSKRSTSKTRSSPKRSRSRSKLSNSESKESHLKIKTRSLSRSRSREPSKLSNSGEEATKSNDKDVNIEPENDVLNSNSPEKIIEAPLKVQNEPITEPVEDSISDTMTKDIEYSKSSEEDSTLNISLYENKSNTFEPNEELKLDKETRSSETKLVNKFEDKAKSRSRSPSKSRISSEILDKSSPKKFRSRSRDRKRTRSPIRNIRRRRSYSSSDSSSSRERRRAREKQSISRRRSRSPRRTSKHSSKRSATPLKRSKRSVTPVKRSKRSVSPRKRSRRSLSRSPSKYRSRHEKKSRSRKKSISRSPSKRSKSRSPRRSLTKDMESDKEIHISSSKKEIASFRVRKGSDSDLRGSDSDI
ncbi:hypothetical protein CEXT_153951 [Caerostris extrusa]|uniref:RRM domain-containing protein n=1 Tax=Caerostris extrusa TaxID=172846 RepID=A0AAV4WPH4_CAEEX|nr:hypothetical protein CEXT_153951 [Caerostris extrusa]